MYPQHYSNQLTYITFNLFKALPILQNKSLGHNIRIGRGRIYICALLTRFAFTPKVSPLLTLTAIGEQANPVLPTLRIRPEFQGATPLRAIDRCRVSQSYLVLLAFFLSTPGRR
jgi:hypothetical protein